MLSLIVTETSAVAISKNVIFPLNVHLRFKNFKGKKNYKILNLNYETDLHNNCKSEQQKIKK